MNFHTKLGLLDIKLAEYQYKRKMLISLYPAPGSRVASGIPVKVNKAISGGVYMLKYLMPGND